jgi:hypothetical protein
MHLQFISDVCEKYLERSNIVNIANKFKIMPNLSISFV